MKYDTTTFKLINEDALDDLWIDQLEELDENDILTFDELVEKVYNTTNQEASMYSEIEWEA